MKEAVRILLLTLSAIAFAGGAVFGVLLIASPSQGGFFPDLGLALGLLAIGAGVLLSCLCNVVAWGLGARSRWIGGMILVQALPALLFAGWLGVQIWDAFQSNRAGDQRSRIHAAIATDDPAAFDAARAQCGTRCRNRASLSEDLLTATDSDAIQIARHLIETGTRMDSADWYGSRLDLHTCEGSYLSRLLGLSVAVARGDPAMVALLLPVSDDRSKDEAILTAARLDRMEMIRMLHAAEIWLPEQENSLLVAAASGAALEVGSWLIRDRPVPIGHDEVTRAMEALYRFMEVTSTQRSLSFARLLTAQGADVDAPFRDEPSFLAEAVRTGRAHPARVLIAAGADPSRLPADRRATLDILLQEPDGVGYDREREGCVAP